MNKPFVVYEEPGRACVPSPARRIRLFDTTLRHAEGIPGAAPNREERGRIAATLDAMRIDTIEAGAPALSPFEYEAVRAVASTVERVEVAAAVRAVPHEIERAVDALHPARRPVVNIVVAASAVHIEQTDGVPRAEALRRFHKAVAFARSHVPDVQFSIEDAAQTDRVFFRQVVQTALSAGATRVGVGDLGTQSAARSLGACVADAAQVAGDRAIISARVELGRTTADGQAIAAVAHGATQLEMPLARMERHYNDTRAMAGERAV